MIPWDRSPSIPWERPNTTNPVLLSNVLQIPCHTPSSISDLADSAHPRILWERFQNGALATGGFASASRPIRVPRSREASTRTGGGADSDLSRTVSCSVARRVASLTVTYRKTWPCDHYHRGSEPRPDRRARPRHLTLLDRFAAHRPEGRDGIQPAWASTSTAGSWKEHSSAAIKSRFATLYTGTFPRYSRTRLLANRDQRGLRRYAEVVVRPRARRRRHGLITHNYPCCPRSKAMRRAKAPRRPPTCPSSDLLISHHLPATRTVSGRRAFRAVGRQNGRIGNTLNMAPMIASSDRRSTPRPTHFAPTVNHKRLYPTPAPRRYPRRPARALRSFKGSRYHLAFNQRRRLTITGRPDRLPSRQLHKAVRRISTRVRRTKATRAFLGFELPPRARSCHCDGLGDRAVRRFTDR